MIKEFLSNAIYLVSIIVFPLMIGLIVVAEPLVEILLTKKWISSVPYIQLFCLIGIFFPIQALNLNALNALGRSDLYLKVDFILKFIIIITISISFRFGIIAMIYGQILNSLIAYYLYSYHIGKILNYSLINQFKDMINPFIISLIMGVCVFAIRFFIDNQLTLLVVQILTGIIIYLGVLYIINLKSILRVVKILKGKSI